MTAKDLSRQQAFDANLKALQQINFSGNLSRDGDANTRMFLIIEEGTETVLRFSQGALKVF